MGQHMLDFLDRIPDGYRIEETDEKVLVLGRRFLRFRAEDFARKYPPETQSYHLRIEKVPNVPCLYEVAAYQNKLVKE